MAAKPYKGEMAHWRRVPLTMDGTAFQPEIYGPNLGYIIQGDFLNHPVFRGLSALGGTTSLVVKHRKDGRIETLNTRYKLVGAEND